jgi:hypothetical protein
MFTQILQKNVCRGTVFAQNDVVSLKITFHGMLAALKVQPFTWHQNSKLWFMPFSNIFHCFNYMPVKSAFISPT